MATMKPILIPKSDLQDVIALIRAAGIKHGPFKRVKDGYMIEFADETLHSYLILRFA